MPDIAGHVAAGNPDNQYRCAQRNDHFRAEMDQPEQPDMHRSSQCYPGGNGYFEQIAAIDRNILRIAFWEFAVSRETPVKVAINEAIELAKTFGSDTAPRFVNGVLGAFLLQHPAGELRH